MEQERQGPSRRVLLAGGVLGLGLWTACSDPHEKRRSTPTSNAIADGPTRLRQQTKTLEPTHYVKTYDVDPSGRDGTYKTLKEVYAAVSQDKAAAGSPGAQSNPWDWRLIRVAKGTYRECAVGIPNHTALVGLGGQPADVTIDFDGDDNTFASTGASTYVRNVRFVSSSRNPETHPMRDAGQSGDVGMRELQKRTVIYERVVFTAKEDAPLTKATNDMAPSSGATLVFVSCTFDGPGQPQAVNLVTNSGPGAGASNFAFIGCKVVCSHSQHPDASLKQLGTGPADPVGIVDFGRGRGDTVVWMDGRWDVGTRYGIEALLAFPYTPDPSWTVGSHPTPSTMSYLVNPGKVAGFATTKVMKALTPRTSIPASLNLPAAGVSVAEKRFFGAKPSPTPYTWWVAPDGDETGEAGTMSVQKGDFYWIPVDLQDRALYAGAVVLDGAAPAPLWAMLALDAQGSPTGDGNGYAQPSARGNTSRVALNPRWFYPGQGVVWIGARFDEAGTVPAVAVPRGGVVLHHGVVDGQVPDAAKGQKLPRGNHVPRLGILGALPPSMRATGS